MTDQTATADVILHQSPSYAKDVANMNQVNRMHRQPIATDDFQGLRDDRIRVSNQVLQTLSSALLDNPSIDLQLPQGLLQRISRDVADSARDEPCGVRGCILLVTVQQKNATQELGPISLDPIMVPTFVMHLTLCEEKKHWFAPLKNLLRPVLNNKPGEPVPNRLSIAPVFQLVKRKLYRSDDHVSEAEEC